MPAAATTSLRGLLYAPSIVRYSNSIVHHCCMHCRAGVRRCSSSGGCLAGRPRAQGQLSRRGVDDMEIVTTRSAAGDRQEEEQNRQGRRRRKASDGHVVAQLLDSPLPTPRRSCCGSAAGTPRGARAASPQRTHVPFSWESSPGVPKAGSACRGAASLERDVLPPKPPPGRRRGGGIGMGTPCHARAACYGNATTTDATSSDDNGGGGGGGSEDDTFSDALDRISSSDRLAARLSSVDGGATSRRLSSFIMDRFLPAANAIATTSTEKRAKKSPRRGRGARRSKHDDEEDVSPAHARRDARTLCRAPSCEHHHVPALQREDSWEYDTHTPPEQQNGGQAQHDEEARGDGDMSPRACGFVVLFPWSVKPVFCGFPWSPARPRTTRRSNVESGSQNGDLSHWYEEKISGSGRREWSSPGGPGLGMSILGTSRRYCADARKALSRLARSATDGGGGGSPRTVSRGRRSGKTASSTLHSTSGRMPQLTPPSESWLRHARGSDTVSNKR
uniref:Uncharacterized protein n=1 Tax=Avena sativa TaxID=4498 RepID=A0ACD5TG17_AVESA